MFGIVPGFNDAILKKKYELNSGDPAVRIPGAQQQPQGAAAGAQIQHGGVFGQSGKVAQHHGIGA